MDLAQIFNPSTARVVQMVAWPLELISIALLVRALRDLKTEESLQQLAAAVAGWSRSKWTAGATMASGALWGVWAVDRLTHWIGVAGRDDPLRPVLAVAVCALVGFLCLTACYAVITAIRNPYLRFGIGLAVFAFCCETYQFMTIVVVG